jgi:hypothetical protein
MTDYKQLCAELLETIDLLTEGDSRPESAAISSARTLLAQPEQAGEVTKAEIHALADELLDGDRASQVDFARAVLARWGRPPSDTESLRSALRECGRAAGAFISDECSDEFLLQIPAEVRLALTNTVWADIHYAWELHDAEGEWQAGGSANSLDDVRREGSRYLQTYSKDGPHKLIIQRHCVTTINEVTQ